MNVDRDLLYEQLLAAEMMQEIAIAREPMLIAPPPVVPAGDDPEALKWNLRAARDAEGLG